MFRPQLNCPPICADTEGKKSARASLHEAVAAAASQRACTTAEACVAAYSIHCSSVHGVWAAEVRAVVIAIVVKILFITPIILSTGVPNS